MSTHQHIISNFYAFFKYLSINSNSKLLTKKDFSAVSTTHSVWPNFTFDLNLNSLAINTQLIEIISGINNNEIPNHIIIDEEQVDKYEEELTQQNFIPLAEWTCLEFNPVPNSQTINNSDLEVKKLTTEEELQQWVEVASTGFGKLDFSLFQKCFGNKSVIFYSGYYQSKIVATALLFFDNETAGIYHVVTLPEFRKKGFGSQLFSYCQQEALQNGAKKIIAQSTQQGLTAWQNTGMRPYGKFYLFCWSKPKS